MAQEFTIKSQDIEDKINQLLPSQGGFAPGVDFSASTMVIPIVDLTETAEGSSLIQDLQTAFSLISLTDNTVTNRTVTIINTTGYFRLFGTIQPSSVAGSSNGNIKITDGTTTKTLFSVLDDGITSSLSVPFDFVVFVEAGDSITVTAGTNCQIQIASRQLADINGNLTNP